MPFDNICGAQHFASSPHLRPQDCLGVIFILHVNIAPQAIGHPLPVEKQLVRLCGPELYKYYYENQ